MYSQRACVCVCVCVCVNDGSTGRECRTGTVPSQRGTAHVMVARSSTNRSLKHLVADPPPNTYSSRSWCAVAMWSERPHGASPYVSGCEKPRARQHQPGQWRANQIQWCTPYILGFACDASLAKKRRVRAALFRGR